MPHIITGRCIDNRYTDCCAVCPVDCFYEIEDPRMLVIDPDTCIDCDLCQEACPVNAIWPDDDLPEEYLEWTDKNAELWEAGTNITEQKEPLERAADLAAVQTEEKEKGWVIDEPPKAEA